MLDRNLGLTALAIKDLWLRNSCWRWQVLLLPSVLLVIIGQLLLAACKALPAANMTKRRLQMATYDQKTQADLRPKTGSEPLPLRTFSTQMYSDMVDDAPRTEAYAAALIEVVKAGDVVVDIGTGAFAVLACQAAQAGAGRVFAIEANRAAAASARRHLAALRVDKAWSRCIILKEGISSDISLPVLVDVIVHELLGEIAGRESAAAILRDAVARFAPDSPRVAAGTWSVPARSRSWLVPARFPTYEQLMAEESPTAWLRRTLPKEKLMTFFENFPFSRCALSTPQYFEVLDFSNAVVTPTALAGKQTRHLTFVVNQSGVFAGFAIFITGEMTPQAVAAADAQDPLEANFYSRECAPPGIGFCSAWRHSSWANPFVRLNVVNGTVLVHRGDVIDVDATVDLTPFKPKYELRAMIRRLGGGKVDEELVLDAVFE